MVELLWCRHQVLTTKKKVQNWKDNTLTRKISCVFGCLCCFNALHCTNGDTVMHTPGQSLCEGICDVAHCCTHRKWLTHDVKNERETFKPCSSFLCTAGQSLPHVVASQLQEPFFWKDTEALNLITHGWWNVKALYRHNFCSVYGVSRIGTNVANDNELGQQCEILFVKDN